MGSRLQTRLGRWIDAAEPTDLLIMTIGFVVLASSFLISLPTSIGGT